MKKITLLFFVALMMLSSINVMAQDEEDEEPFRVAAVAPSATNDLAFSQSMYDALLAVQEDFGGEEYFEFVFQDGTFIVDDAAVALREWAASGEYDLIIAHGSQFGAILEELAPEFPEVSFAWGTDENTFGLDNVFAYTAAAEEGGFINGFVAANLTETGSIGVIGPVEVGDAKLYVDGFLAGVAAYDPEIEVGVTYIQSFSDVPLATEAAEAFLANDADVLTGTAQMVVGPIAVAQEAGVPWFGTQSSQAELAGEIGMVFQVYKWEVVLYEIIDSIDEGVLGGESFTIDLENGGLEMEISEYAFVDDEETLADLEEGIEILIEGIISGEIVIFPEEAEEAEATEEPGS